MVGMSSSAATAGQTVGPFFHCALPYSGDNRLISDTHPGAVRLHGTVYDGADDGVPDALVELWQPDPHGNIVQHGGSLRRDGSTFTGWGRSATDAAGHYEFTTLAPGSVVAGRPPFFAITVFARGLLDRLFTRAYLPDGNLHADPLFAAVDIRRQNTLVCVAENDRTGYRFDIQLQGSRAHPETVFLAFDGEAR
jgi:protocatechuate 3,4-dioxygenase alpha subunit